MNCFVPIFASKEPMEVKESTIIVTPLMAIGIIVQNIHIKGLINILASRNVRGVMIGVGGVITGGVITATARANGIIALILHVID